MPPERDGCTHFVDARGYGGAGNLRENQTPCHSSHKSFPRRRVC